MIMAAERLKIKSGIKKVRANKNLAKKVETVASQIWRGVEFASYSTEMWMPKASENASAIAIVKTPPITARRELVPAFKPTISPSVVIVAEVSPKLNPFFIELFESIKLFFGGARKLNLIKLHSFKNHVDYKGDN